MISFLKFTSFIGFIKQLYQEAFFFKSWKMVVGAVLQTRLKQFSLVSKSFGLRLTTFKTILRTAVSYVMVKQVFFFFFYPVNYLNKSDFPKVIFGKNHRTPQIILIIQIDSKNF